MSYLVLARKWRPLTFDDLIGQAHIARTLAKAIETKRVAHAFLFTGTRGVGKTTTARLLAMALNCEKGPTAKPCGVCHSCREIQGGIGLDVMEIDGASNRGIDEIRDLREHIAYTPVGGKSRIVIIDEVHMLTKEAFNALLKSLEEPPPNFIFIFATTEPQKVPETILSRIQRYDFKRISPVDVMARLKFICLEEKIAFDEEALLLVARKANGSMRDALTLLDQIIPFCTGQLTSVEVRSVLGLVDTESYLTLFQSLLAKDEGAVMERVAAVFAEGYDLAEFSDGLQEHVRHLLLARLRNADPVLFNLPADAFDKLREQSKQFHETDLLRMLDILSRLTYRISNSTMPRFELEAALLKLARLDDAVEISALLRGAGPEQKKKSDLTPSQRLIPKPPISVSPPPQEEMPIVTLGLSDLKVRWRDCVKAITMENMKIGTYLSYSAVLDTQENEIRIGIPRNLSFQYQQMMKPDNQRVLIDFFKRHCGYEGHLSLESMDEEKGMPASGGNGVAASGVSAGPIPRTMNINEAAEKEPIIGTLLDMFNGEVK